MTNKLQPDALILACWSPEDPLMAQMEPAPALMPMGDKPMLQRVLEKLVDVGCKRITVVHGDRPQLGEALLGDGERWGCQISHQYAAAGNNPLGMLARLVPEDDRDCILAPADTVALIDLDTTKHSAVFSLESGVEKWTGWAILPWKTVRSLTDSVQDSQDLGRRIKAHADQERSMMLMAKTVSTASVAATLDSLPQLFAQSPGLAGISRRPRSEGIWIGNGSRIHPSARLHAPVFIGQNVLVAEDVEIGPHAAVGDGCIIDAGSHIADSMLLPNTYIGQKLDVRGTMLAGSNLVNSRLGVAMRITDPEFLREIDRLNPGSPRVPIKQRLLAAVLRLCLAPLRLLWQFRSADPRHTTASIGVPTSVASVYRPLMVRFAMSHEEIRKSVEGAWTNHFRRSFLPGLLDVIEGKVALVGLQPRSAAEITALPHYWRRLYDTTPAGLLNEALLQSTEDASPEMLHAGDALCSAPMPLLKVMNILWQYAKKVMAEAVTPHQNLAAASEKTAAQQIH